MATKTCSDGFVRSCTVKTSDCLIQDRDVRKIVLLEEAHLSSHDGISPSQNDDGPAGSSDDSNQLDQGSPTVLDHKICNRPKIPIQIVC